MQYIHFTKNLHCRHSIRLSFPFFRNEKGEACSSITIRCLIFRSIPFFDSTGEGIIGEMYEDELFRTFSDP